MVIVALSSIWCGPQLYDFLDIGATCLVDLWVMEKYGALLPIKMWLHIFLHVSLLTWQRDVIMIIGL